MAGVQSKTGYSAISALLKSKASVAALLSGVGKGDPKKTEDALRQVQYQLDLQTQLLIALAGGGDSLSVLGAGGEPIGWIGSDADKVGAWFKNLYVGGASPDDAQIVADANGDVTITGALTAASFNVWAPLIEADPFTDNDPGAGRVSWASFSLFFAGTEYTIASGDTSSSTHKHIYWVRGASALTTAIEMPQDVDNYLIASNISGVHELVLNKPGAGKSITEDALVPNLLKGIAIQPEASGSIMMGSGSTVTILNVESGGGVLIGLYFLITTSITGTGPTTTLKIQVDGETEQTLALHTASSAASTQWDARTNSGQSGDMSTSGDYRRITLGLPFSSSITVKVTDNNVASTGTMAVYAVYGLKTSL